jgi:dolichyl-phosphate-mannose-protein mannosyltransferase
MRLLPAVCGALIVPLSFLIMKEMHVSLASSLFLAVLLTFDNSLVAQSRLILLDSMLVLFCMMALYSFIRFYKKRYE